MGKIVIGIDYNNICNRGLFSCKFSSTDVIINDYSTEEEQGVLFRKLCWDIWRVTNIFNPDDVYIFADSKNQWRKVKIADYKGNRQKSEDIDYPSVYKVMADLLDTLKSKGYKVFDVDGAEADDLAAIYKSRMSNDPDTSMIFVTSDHDWHQLISYDETNKQFCAVYNAIANNKGRHTLTGTRGFVEWLLDGTFDAFDMLNVGFAVKPKLVTLLKNEEYAISLNEVDPNSVLMTKILCGDDGDNIRTLFEYYKPDGKKKRITPTIYKKIVEACNLTNVASLNESLNNGSLKNAVGDAMKYDVDDVDFDTRVMEQRLAVELNPELFPSYVVEGYVETESKLYKGVVNYPKSGSEIYAGTKYQDANPQSQPNAPRLNDSFASILNGKYKF